MANDYTLGRGKVFFDPFVTGSTVTAATVGLGERYFGNTPEFSMASESSKLDHFNADAGVREKDRSVLLELNRTGSFTCDNINADNLALFVLGEVSTVSQTLSAGQVTTYDAVLAERYYQIGAGSSNPAGVRDVSSVVITDTDTPATTYVLNVDYTLDADLARIQVIAASSMVGKDITITYTRNATTYERVTTAAASEVEGALRFVSFNAEGSQRDWYFPYVRLTPSGDMALKGDDWQVVSFDVEVLKKADTVAAIYIDGRPA